MRLSSSFDGCMYIYQKKTVYIFFFFYLYIHTNFMLNRRDTYVYTKTCWTFILFWLYSIYKWPYTYPPPKKNITYSTSTHTHVNGYRTHRVQQDRYMARDIIRRPNSSYAWDRKVYRVAISFTRMQTVSPGRILVDDGLRTSSGGILHIQKG